ncbi:uncharacterized protein VTP21DRAFT_6392 [Calcarisporiella thermophila]|uniref:uncharacterized protein n=1 Tax=Calcarisporiella thermophila TaxID=911321 RepID=UPI003741F9F8
MTSNQSPGSRPQTPTRYSSAPTRIGLKQHQPLLANMITLIDAHGLQLMILDCPTDSTLHLYLQEFKKSNVKDVVRVCEPTYNAEVLESEGIHVHDMPFKDGEAPPPSIVRGWLSLVDKRRREYLANGNDKMESSQPPTIAVHCVAGLGRACVMVAIALIEFGMQPLEAIEHVRLYRKGAFNKRQIEYLDSYKRSMGKWFAKPSRGAGSPLLRPASVSGDMSGNKEKDKGSKETQPNGNKETSSTSWNPFTRMFNKNKKVESY